MKGAGFLRRIQAIGHATGTAVVFDLKHGKGSHGRLYYGSAFTTLKDRKKEIGAGLLAKMLRDLGIERGDFDRN